MKNKYKITALFVLALLVTSCKNEKSLQSYLVETSNKEGFYAGDFPIGSLFTPKENASTDVLQTIKSIKKVNIVFLPVANTNTAEYNTEKETLKGIFKDNKTYKSLMSMKAKGMNIAVYYSGKSNAIDEMVAFGYGEKVGVGVARLLGNNINPEQVIQMLQNVDVENEGALLQEMLGLFQVNKKL